MASDSASDRLQLGQRFLSRIGLSETEAAVEMLSPAATYHVPGSHSLSGRFTTPEAIVDHMRTFTQRTKGTYETTKWNDWLVGESHVSGIAQVQMQAAGRRFSGRVVYLMHFDIEDLIDLITVFFEDAEAAGRFLGT